MIESSFPCPSFGPVNREKRRAHMKAEMWREQVLLDDVDATTLGNDACVLELTLSKWSACEVFAAVVKTIKRVRRLMLDSGCSIDLIGLDDLSREERDLIVQNAKISLRTANGKQGQACASWRNSGPTAHNPSIYLNLSAGAQDPSIYLDLPSGVFLQTLSSRASRASIMSSGRHRQNTKRKVLNNHFFGFSLFLKEETSPREIFCFISLLF